MKGLNLADASSGNFDKNLTGQLYELSDEVRLVHEHLPHAHMSGVFFLPLQACADKTHAAPSSVAHTATKLRDRTGRLDWSLPGQASKCDSAFVAIYSGANSAEAVAGALRFCDATESIARRGRSRLADTLSLDQVVETIIERAYLNATGDWRLPEDGNVAPGE